MLTTVWQNLIIGILPESQIDVGSIKEVYHGIEKETGELKIAVSTIKCRLEESNQGFQEAVRTYDMIDTMRKYSEKIGRKFSCSDKIFRRSCAFLHGITINVVSSFAT